jgi:acyl-CoA thioesterase
LYTPMKTTMSSPRKGTENYGPHNVHMQDWIDCAPFERLLNIEIREAKNGEAVLRMPFSRELAQGFGLMHGGALLSLADTSFVMAIKSLLPPGSRFATTRLATDYLKPVTCGIVTARARITHCDDRDIFGESEIVDEGDDQVLKCKCTFRVARDVPLEALHGITWSTPDEK